MSTYKNMTTISAVRWFIQNFTLTLDGITKLLAVKTTTRTQLAVNPDLCGQEARTGLPPLGRAWVSGLVKPMIPDVKGEQKIERTYRVNTQTRKVRDDKTLRGSLPAVKPQE